MKWAFVLFFLYSPNCGKSFSVFDWNPRVVITQTLSSLATILVVITTILGATSDNKVTTLGLKTLSTIDAYMRHWTGSSMIQVMVWHPTNASIVTLNTWNDMISKHQGSARTNECKITLILSDSVMNGFIMSASCSWRPFMIQPKLRCLKRSIRTLFIVVIFRFKLYDVWNILLP